MTNRIYNSDTAGAFDLSKILAIGLITPIDSDDRPILSSGAVAQHTEIVIPYQFILAFEKQGISVQQFESKKRALEANIELRTAYYKYQNSLDK